MGQSFYSISAAIVFSALGLIFGYGAATDRMTTIAGVDLSMSLAWALTGLMFVMAYFSMIHLRHNG